MYKELNLCFIALTLVLVGGRLVTSAPQGYLKRAILIDIKLLLDILPKDEEELYTPENTAVKCAREVMVCYVTEIGALAQETEDRNINKIIGRIQKNIGAALNYTPSTDATGLNSIQRSEPSEVTLTPSTSRSEEATASLMNVCPPCESHELQKSRTFLQRMVQFVQFALSDSGLKEH